MPLVVCPRCGHVFAVRQAKGGGAWYAMKIKDLTDTHYAILRALFEVNIEKGAVDKETLRAELEKRGLKLTGNALSGRLSELLGLGLVGCERRRVRLLDERAQKYRYAVKPLWYVTLQGRSLVR